MLNTVSAYEFDTFGYVELNVLDESLSSEITRRVQRSATLDGGATLSDGGFSNADRTISLEWKNTSLADSNAISRMLQLYSRVVVSVRDGVFLAAPEQFKPRETCTLRLLVLEKLSA